MFSPFSQNEIKLTDNNTEPMTLGSPVSSPKTKMASNQNYLPPYLFGEVVTSPVGTAAWNTPKQHNTSFQSSSFQLSSPVSHFRDPQLSYQSPVSSSIISTPNAGKSGGPPIQGLLYTANSPAASFDVSKLDVTPKTPSRQIQEHSFSGILTPSQTFSVSNTSLLSPAQLDPFYTQGEALKNSDQLDESWVTVFGFPSASASYILQQFSQYGNIIEHKSSPTGNWMHIRYQSKLQAKKALSKNGKIFSNIMIGVKPCIEMDIMESSKENSLHEKNMQGQESFKSNIEPTKPTLKNIRPLTQAYQSPNAQAQAIPQKSGNIVSKALEYIWKV